MPAHNAEQTIASALKSTLKFLPKDSRIVVWNDGSSDQTLDCVSRLADSRVQVMDSAISVGGGVARSEVIAQTDSEFVANMDADDICFPWRFAVQHHHIQSVDISFTAAIKFGNSLRQIRPTSPLPYRPEDVAASLAFHNTLSHPSMFARRSALELAGGYRDLKVAQDYDLWLRAATVDVRMGRIGLPCIGYRQSPVQISKQAGYNQRIVSQHLINDAYLAYAEHRVPGTSERLQAASAHEQSRDSALNNLLSAQLRDFNPILRAYYKQLLRQKRLGPFAVSKLAMDTEK
nr:glycosyltransferase [Arthrobacter sp. 4R501]